MKAKFQRMFKSFDPPIYMRITEGILIGKFHREVCKRCGKIRDDHLPVTNVCPKYWGKLYTNEK